MTKRSLARCQPLTTAISLMLLSSSCSGGAANHGEAVATTVPKGNVSLEVPVTPPPTVNVPVTTPKGVNGVHSEVPTEAPCTIKATVRNDTLGFAKDSSTISADGSAAVAEFIRQALVQSNNLERVEVRGYASSEGGEQYNQDLSQRRSDAMEAFLRTLLPMQTVPIDSKGMGEARPVGSNDTEAGRSANRRVEIFLHFSGCT